MVKALRNVVIAPFLAIFIHGRRLLLHKIGDYDKYEDRLCGLEMEVITGFKIFEHFFEALPQLTLSLIFISNHGGLSDENIVNIVSAIFSFGSLIIGIVTACSSCCNLFFGNMGKSGFPS